MSRATTFCYYCVQSLQEWANKDAGGSDTNINLGELGVLG